MRSAKQRWLAWLLVICLTISICPTAWAREAGQAADGKVKWSLTGNDSVETTLPESSQLADKDGLTDAFSGNLWGYGADDTVRVLIELEDAPVLERGYSVQALGESREAARVSDTLEAKQERLSRRISQMLPEGASMQVEAHLTLASNAMAVSLPYGMVEKLAGMSGVKAVYLDVLYEVPETETGDRPQTATASDMVGASAAWSLGYTGAGSRIAVIDTGICDYNLSFDSGAFLQHLRELYAADKSMDPAQVTDETVTAYYDLLTEAEIEALLPRLNAHALNTNTAADELYKNSKIAFAFNYQDKNTVTNHDSDTQGSHGSHVSGIAAANYYVPWEAGYASAVSKVHAVGVAPDAQIITMKVFGATGGAYASVYVQAIEDALLLNCDAINLSLGSAAPGFRTAQDSFVDGVFAALEKAQAVVTISAGNNGTWADYLDGGVGLIGTRDVNLNRVGSPSSFANSLSVASMDNSGETGAFSTFRTSDGKGEVKLMPNDRGENYGLKAWTTLDAGGGTVYPVVFLGDPSALLQPGYTGQDAGNYYGAAEDYKGLDLSGKILMVSRGKGISFADKFNRAVKAGAAAVVVYNNAEGDLNMDMTGAESDRPCVSVTLEQAQAIFALSEKKDGLYTASVKVSSEIISVGGSKDTFTMSSFSSWGTSGALTIKPEVTTPGGSIWSVANGKTAYETMSGTSMAAPNMAGQAAVLAEYIRKNFDVGPDGLVGNTGLTVRALAHSLVMSAAEPILDQEAGGLPYPVRAQGAGLANVADTLRTKAFLSTGDADGKVKAELGDDPSRTGEYEIVFAVNNLTGTALTYVLRAQTMAPGVETVDGTAYLSKHLTSLGAEAAFLVDGAECASRYAYDLNGDGKVDEEDLQDLIDYLNGLDTLTDEQAEPADFNGTGKADEEDAYTFLRLLNGDSDGLQIDLYRQTGVQVEIPARGSVQVTLKLRLTAAGRAYIEENFENGTFVEGFVYADAADGVDLSLPFLGFYGDWSDASMFDHGDYIEDTFAGQTGASYLGMQRYLGYSFAENPTAEIYFSGNLYAKDEAYHPERNAISSLSGDALKSANFTLIRDAEALWLEIVNAQTGEAYVSMAAERWPAAYYNPSTGKWVNPQLSGTMDWKAVDGKGNPLPDGTQVIVRTAAIPEYNTDGAQPSLDGLGSGVVWEIPFVVDNTAPVLKDISYSFTDQVLTVTGTDNRYLAAVSLFNGRGNVLLEKTAVNQNEVGQEVELTFDLSAVDSDGLMVQLTDYAGNQTTAKIDLTVGNPTQAYVPVLYAFDAMSSKWISFDNTEGMEAAVLYADSRLYYAAEYVGGYVFAATAQQMFVIPFGQWDRAVMLANLPENVRFVDMAYNAANRTLYALDTENRIYSIGQTTGKATAVGTVNVPEGTTLMTLACDGKGTFYSVSLDDSNSTLYRFSVNAVGGLAATREIGSTGRGCRYVQSMAWDHDADALYWARYDGANGELCAVNPNSGKATTEKSLGTELTGLFLLTDETVDYGMAERVTGVELSAGTMSMMLGGEAQLTAMIQPWNVADASVTWTTSSADVVYVDDSGLVSARAAGTAVVMATSNQNPACVAACIVTVAAVELEVEGEIDGTEYWTSISSDTMMEPRKLRKVGKDLAGVVYAGGGIYYGYDADSMYRIDAGQNYRLERVSTLNSNNFGDAAYSPTYRRLVMTMGAYYLVTADVETWHNPFFQLTLDSALTSIAYWYTYVEDGVTYDVFVVGTSEGLLYRMRYDGSKVWIQRMGATGVTISPGGLMQSPKYASLWVDHGASMAYWSYRDTEGVQQLLSVDLSDGTTTRMGAMGLENATGLCQRSYSGALPLPDLFNASSLSEESREAADYGDMISAMLPAGEIWTGEQMAASSPRATASRRSRSTARPNAVITAEIGDLSYALDAETGTAVVTGYGVNADTTISTLTIPALVEYSGKSYRVTEVGDAAFKNNGTIAHVSFPETMEVIGAQAFMGCALLEEILLPDSVKTVRDEAFSFYKSFAADQPNVVKKLKLSASLEFVGKKSFAGMMGVTELLTLPASLKTIDDHAFFRLGQTGEFVVPATVQKLGRYAFDHNDNITRLTILGTEIVMDIQPFGQCQNLTEVVLPEGIKTLPNSMFVACPALVSINLPDSLEKVGTNLFNNCTKLETVRIPAGLSVLPAQMFGGCTALKEITIPENITAIGNYVFWKTRLTAVTIPANVKTLGDSAFSECTQLKTVTFEEGCTISVLSSCVFEKCSALERIEIPASVTEIARSAFVNCRSMKEIVFPADTKLTTIRGSAFQNCGSLTEVTIPESVTTLEGYSFAGCSKLETVRLLCAVSDYGTNYAVFSNCTALKNLEFGEKFTCFGDRMFNGCSSLTSVTIPVQAVRMKQGNPFTNCAKLTEILVEDGNPAFKSVDGVLYSMDGKTLIGYPNAKSGAIVIPEGVEEIGAFAFYYMSSAVPSITFPSTLTTIGYYSFAYATGFSGELVLPDSVTMLKTNYDDPTKGYGYNFSNMKNVTRIVLPARLKVLPAYALQGCSALTEIVLPDLVENLGMSAFSGCSALESITIPGTVHTLNNSVFGGSCTKLKQIYFEGSVPAVNFSVSALPNTAAISSTVYYPERFQGVWNAKIEEFNSQGKYKYVFWQTYAPQLRAAYLERTEMDMIQYETGSLVPIVHAAGAPNTDVTWTSDHPEVVEVDAAGALTAKKPGTAVITITTAEGGFTASCTVRVTEYVAVTALRLNQTEAVMNRGELLTLQASVLPENASYPTVSWSTSDPSVARVDGNGVVTAVGGGTAVITAVSNDEQGLSASCVVTVNKVDVMGVTLSAEELVMSMRETARLYASVAPADATVKAVSWESSDPSVVSVAFGVLTAKSTGTAVITVTAKDGGFTAQCRVTVNGVAPSRVDVDPVELELYTGEEADLQADVKPADAADRSVVWNSSDPTIAAVDENGHVTALLPGDVLITASAANGKQGTCYVSVLRLPTPIEQVTLDQTSLEVKVGESQRLSVQVLPAHAEDRAVTWESSDPKIASVSNAGVVTGCKAGTATITVTTRVSGKTAVCQVTVSNVPVERVTLSQEHVTLEEGRSAALVAAVAPENATFRSVSWESSDPAVVSVSAAGLIRGAAPGTAVITATADGVSASCTVTVKAKRIAVTGLTLDRTAVVLLPEQSIRIRALLQPDNATDARIVWTSEDPAVASVEDGTILAMAPGETRIIAKTEDGGFEAVVSVTVRRPGEGTNVNLQAEVDQNRVTVSVQAASAMNYGRVQLRADDGLRFVEEESSVRYSSFNEKTMSYVFVSLEPTAVGSELFRVIYEADPGTYSVEAEGASCTATVKARAHRCADFTDISTHWAYAYLCPMIENGYLAGYGDGTVRPDGAASRAMAVSLLYRIAGSPAVEYDGRFADVKAGDWYAGAISWAAAAGVAAGYPDGTFHPNQTVTREELAALLYRALGRPETTGSLEGFRDADRVSAWAVPAMSYLTEQGIMSGTAKGVLSPRETATRAQLCVLLVKAYHIFWN